MPKEVAIQFALWETQQGIEERCDLCRSWLGISGMQPGVQKEYI